MQFEETMSARVKDILVELKARLEATGYNVHIGKEFADAETDPMPMVSVFFGAKGESGVDGELNNITFELQKQELHLIVECHAEIDPDQPLMDLEDIHTVVKGAIFTPAGGQIADGQFPILTRRRSWPHPQFSNVAFFQIELRIPFREDY